MKLQPLHRKAEGLLFCWGVFYILSPVGSFLPIAAESLPVVSADLQPRCGMETGTLPGNHLAVSATGGYSEVVSKERRGRNPWFLHLLCCVLRPVEEDGVHLHYIALSFRWNLYRQSKGIFIRGPRQNKQSGFVGERRHSTVIDACRLRRAERYKACVDDMPFDCLSLRGVRGLGKGFGLIQ